MALYDISQSLRVGVPVWPGDTTFAARTTWAMGPDCPVTVSAVTLSTHTGTHADAPLHYEADGAACADVPLDPYLGPCRLVHLIEPGRPIEARDLAAALADCPPRLLIRTYAAFPHHAWRSDWTSIAPDAIDALAAAGVRLIGVDAPSLDPQDSKTMDAHAAVARRGLAILEGLVLDAVPPGDYELIALPLKLAGLDASPVRAVLRA